VEDREVEDREVEDREVEDFLILYYLLNNIFYVYLII
jgi:hypothetical protein